MSVLVPAVLRSLRNLESFSVLPLLKFEFECLTLQVNEDSIS